MLERFSPESIRGYRSEEELRYLVGTGVSAAAIFHLRAELDRAGFDKVKIVASSGFGPAKCRVMAEAKAPIDVVGTGSFLPSNWTETYATADIVEYDGEKRVKIGREFLHRGKPNGAAKPLVGKAARRNEVPVIPSAAKDLDCGRKGPSLRSG